MLASKSLRELLEIFSAPTPTPGGGSAAALAGAVAASLLAMVAGMPKTRTGAPNEREALDAVRLSIVTRMAELMDLVDRDAAAYDEVVAAYRLPKATDEDKAARKAAIGRAMRAATDAPLDTARAASALLAHGAIVREHGNPNASSDVGVAMSLAAAAFSGAAANVEANLDGVGDPAYAAAVRAEIERMERA
jgi:formiminotetrahydrofolate cyclodeaminase